MASGEQKWIARLAAATVLTASAFSGAAHAGVVGSGATLVPTIVAGDPHGTPPDSPGNRVDPNVPGSPFSGVVSINIVYDGESYICSGTLVSKRDIVTAGHCVDTTGNGTLVDLHKPGSGVVAVFNAASSGAGSAVIAASAVSMNPNYQGFGNCPAGVDSFCVNDDVAVIHLAQDAPASAKIYKVYSADLMAGTQVTMVGYGLSGDGVNGYTVNPAFRIKRTGMNIVDGFDGDDETGFSTGPNEVWYADFDGGGTDTLCDLAGWCTAGLPNDQEAMIGGGDSGGPTFMMWNGEYVLVGNNTFSTNYEPGTGPIPGAFGNYFGGIVLTSYTDYLLSATNGAIGVVPEPGSIAILLAGLGMMGLASRRRRAN